MFVVGGDGDLKFDRQVESNKSLTKDNKTSLKEAWSGHVNHFNFDEMSSDRTEARVIKFCTPIGYVKSQHVADKSPLKWAWTGSRDPFFFKLCPNHIF